MRYIVWLLLFCLVPFQLYAEVRDIKKTNLSQKKLIKISTGTGFYVDNNHIVTNAHVVNNCKSVHIRGKILASKVDIMGIDQEKDLAILNTSTAPEAVATLRSNHLVSGEHVTIAGFPIGENRKVSYQVNHAKIVNPHSIYNNELRVEFSNSVAKGNSGGPLLDKSGNVIGVIVGKVLFYKNVKHKINIERNKPFKISSIAIPLHDLVSFLKKHKVEPKRENSYSFYEDSEIGDKAKDYTVHVNCVQGS